MVPKKRKSKLHRTVLRLSDLDHSKAAVLNALTSPESRRTYGYAIEQFIAWYCSEPRLALNRIVVVRYRIHLEASGLAAATINQRLAAVRRLAHEAAAAPREAVPGSPTDRPCAAGPAYPARILGPRRAALRPPPKAPAAAFGDHLVRLRRQFGSGKVRPRRQQFARLRDIQQVGAMLVCAYKPADGSVTRGEQKAGARRLGQQRLDVGLAPDIIHYDERRFVSNGGAVLVLAGQVSVVAAEVGTDFKPVDQLFFDQIKEEAVSDTAIQQAAMVNSLENFGFVFDKALEGKFIDRMDQNQEIFARCMNDKDFQKAVAEWMRKEVYEQVRKDAVPTVTA
jgi:hypothetical protein